MENFLSVTQDFLSTKWFIFIGTATIVLLIHVRAKSTHSVFEHVWRLVAGKSEVRPGPLKDFMQQMRDMERFRFVYGIRITSSRKLLVLLEWLRIYDVDIGKVRQAWRWLEIKEFITIKLPSKYFLMRSIIIFTFSIFILYTGIWQLSIREVYLKFNDIDVWYVLSADTIHHVFKEERFKLQMCQGDEAGLASKTGLTKYDASIVCGAIREGQWEAQLSELRHDQQKLGAALICFSMLGFGWSYRRQRSSDEAHMLDRLVKEAATVSRTPVSEVSANSPPKPRRRKTTPKANPSSPTRGTD